MQVNSALLLLLFVGVIMVINGVYEEKYTTLKNKEKVVYKFIPRSYYDEMLYQTGDYAKFDSLYEQEVDTRSAARNL